MTIHDIARTTRAWPALALAAVLAALLPGTALAALSATATIQPTPLSGGTYHYDLVLTNSGTTSVGTFWFAWIPGAGFMPSAPSNIQSPAGWSATVTNAGGAIQWAASSTLAAGNTLSGFSFDSAVTPAQMTGPSSTPNDPVDTSFVYIGAPLADPGLQLVPTLVTASPSPVVASVLPGGRSVQVGTTATVFATMVNSGSSSLSGCSIAVPASVASVSMTYQTTNNATNALTGTPNTPVTIPGNDGSQSFLLSFSAASATTVPALALDFDCTGTQPVTTITGVNTVDLLFSSTPVADIIALAATASGDGILTVPLPTTDSAGAFAVATANAGAADTITVSADTGSATLPLTATLCETVPSTGACMASPAASVTLSDAAGATPTFSVFVQATSPIALNPATARIFLRFKDASGTSHGSTSVAVATANP